MAKGKKKGRKSSDIVHKLPKKKKLNPFEIHVNKEKLRVLGKKHKNDRGLPGVSRGKALNKRKQTLQQEYKLQHKSNRFLDKRLGEGNAYMTEEDKFIARYAKIKAKHHKKSIFNLADEEILTHKGQTLNEIEKFEDPRSDDDEDDLDDDRTGKLDANFVDEAHFGGGVLKRTGMEGAKSHKDLIDQLIAESKKRKAEKQKLKEETLELTEKLDTEWKDLLPLVNKTKPQNIAENEKADEYDKVMRQLKFEARGTPSDRLKSEDEIAKEEKEKLEILEKERLERMHGFTEKNKINTKHYSADDLDDNFAYESDTEITLSYNNEGTANINIEGQLNGRTIMPKGTGDDSGNDEEESVSSEGDSENCDEESESDNNLSDLRQEDVESESDNESYDAELKTVNTESLKQNMENYKEQIRHDLFKRKEVMDKARQELPYTFKLPKCYEDLSTLLQEHSAEKQYIILERMIKCNHPSLGKENKQNLNVLFAYLLQYIDDLSSNIQNKAKINECFNIYSNLVPHLFDLAQISPENAHILVREVIKEKHLNYRKNKSSYPGIEVLLFLKLISCIFSTSDFRHVVVTPSLVFIDQMLNKCKVRKQRDISFGLFLTTLMLEYTNLSKRFLPSTINFLAGVLHMCIPKAGIRLIKVAPPFKSSSNALVLFNNCSETCDLKLQMDFAYLLEGEIGDVYKIRTFYTALCLLEEFATNFQDLSSKFEIFIPVERYLKLIPIQNYPAEIRKKAEMLKETISVMKNNRTLKYLVVEKKRPKALRLYEPNVEKVYDTKKRKVQSKEKAERDKLLHKLKREKKGALREIRRDKAFLARLKINKQVQSDNERKAKVRKLLSEASMQQGELNAIDRKKKRSK